jgi:hypothetical protein
MQGIRLMCVLLARPNISSYRRQAGANAAMTSDSLKEMWLAIQRALACYKRCFSFAGAEANRLLHLHDSSALQFAFGGITSVLAYNSTEDLSQAVKALEIKADINVSTQLLPHRKLALALCGSHYITNDMQSFVKQ